MTAECLAELRRAGILLKADPSLPSVTTIVTGGPVRGSWWSHPAGRQIFRTLTELAAHADVVFVKLVNGKDTLLHRMLWPELYVLAASDEDWQRTGLSTQARRLHEQVEKSGTLEASGDLPRELERRLLVRGEQFHTDEGHHGKQLESWTHWAERVNLDARRVTVAEAKAAFESAMPKARFPWTLLR